MLIPEGRDITSRREAESALYLSQERLQLALEGSGDGLWDWNIVTGEVYLSPEWLAMLGYEVGELPGHISTWERVIHPDDRPWVMERLNAHLKDSTSPYSFEYRSRNSRSDLRAFLYHQRTGTRNGIGAVNGIRHRQKLRRIRASLKRGGRGDSI